MKTSTKKILTTVILITVISFTVNAQTNVSGGIFSNTTWTLAGSPYIVVDTIVVFPGVTLTIDPGVLVKFDNDKRIEIRQAKLIATGTSTDSITFTSNSVSPIPGIYPGIYLNGGNLPSSFNYCSISYATIGVRVAVSGSVIVNHSDFIQNVTGLQFINSAPGVASIDSSSFNYNTNGLILYDLAQAALNYCDFSYNSNTGLILGDPVSAASQFSSTLNYCNFSHNDIGMGWDMYYSLIDHSNFSNNTTGLKAVSGGISLASPYNIVTKNCVFDSNQTGLMSMNHMLIDSCMISHNQTGYNSGLNKIKNCTIDSNSIAGLTAYSDTIMSCNIRYNGAGIVAWNTKIFGSTIEYSTGDNINIGSAAGFNVINGNTIRYGSIGINNTAAGTFVITKNIIDSNNLGINLSSSNTTINCNRICNNATYDLTYIAISNLNAGNNYWCTPDSASTEVVIYDGYDNINYGLVSFMPLDTNQCYSTTGIAINSFQNISLNIFPNPVFDKLNVILNNHELSEIILYDIASRKLLQQEFTNSITLKTEQLAKGLYLYEVRNKNGVIKKGKVVKD